MNTLYTNFNAEYQYAPLCNSDSVNQAAVLSIATDEDIIFATSETSALLKMEWMKSTNNITNAQKPLPSAAGFPLG